MNADVTIQIERLPEIGINPNQIIYEFAMQKKIKLDVKEYLRIRTTDEGKSINFQTLDQISISVNPIYSNGVPNKVEPPEKF